MTPPYLYPLETGQQIWYTLPVFKTSKGHRLLAFFSSLELTGKRSKCNGKTGQGAASPRLHPGWRRESHIRATHTAAPSLREEGGTTHNGCFPKLRRVTGLCQVSPRNSTLWKCYVFSHMCDFRLQDAVLSDMISLGTNYRHKTARPLPWRNKPFVYRAHYMKSLN